jgi:hypothetical protein
VKNQFNFLSDKNKRKRKRTSNIKKGEIARREIGEEKYDYLFKCSDRRYQHGPWKSKSIFTNDQHERCERHHAQPREVKRILIEE